jgi:ribosome-interacting GTPase 1
VPIDAEDRVAARPTIIIANKLDLPGASDNLQILREFYQSAFEIRPVSALTGEGIEPLRQVIFDKLDVIRIYTKAPGKKLDPKAAPFVLKKGSNVLDAARTVHREFAHSLKFARVWSSDNSKSNLKRSGQKVERMHILEDGDILELHL